MNKTKGFMVKVKALMEDRMFDGKKTSETPMGTTPNGHGCGSLVLMEKTGSSPFRNLRG